jgi:hypothetical protein
MDWPLPNVLLGTSVEDQATADQRIPHLLRCPAAVHFVSYEPALGPVDLTPYVGGQTFNCPGCGFHKTEGELLYLGGDRYVCADCEHRCEILPAVRWVIVGGESGLGARPLDIAWARSTVVQCRAGGVPVFVKQLGARPFHGECRGFPHVPGDVTSPATTGDGEGRYFVKLRDRKGGDWSEWPEDLRVREFPGTA